MTPAAKRPTHRVLLDPSADMPVISHQEMSDVVQRMHLQYTSDMEWIVNAVEGIRDHADRIDIIQQTCSNTASQLVGTRGVVVGLEKEAKDYKIRLDATQDDLNKNDLATKKTLGENDANLRANLALESQKIELLMEEARRLQGIIDEQHASFEERMLPFDQGMQVVQQVTGDPNALRATAMQLTSQDSQIKLMRDGM